MTFLDLRVKLIRRWWVPVIFSIIIGTTTFASIVQQQEYQATITLNFTTKYDREVVAQTLYPNIDKLNLDIDRELLPQLDPQNANKEFVYFRLLTTMNSYFINRFAQTDTQSQIARDINHPSENLQLEQPFYKIYDNGAASITFVYKTDNQAQANIFISSIKNAFDKLINEWNTEKDIFALKASTNVVEPSVIKLEPKIQEKILPFIAGAILGLTLSIILPNCNRKII